MPRPAMPTPPAAPKKDLPKPFKGGDRVLDRDEVVAEGFGKFGRGTTLREARKDSRGPGYNAVARDMINQPPREGTTYRPLVGDRGIAADVPTSERYERYRPGQVGRSTARRSARRSR